MNYHSEAGKNSGLDAAAQDANKPAKLKYHGIHQHQHQTPVHVRK
jgi:hypothetical protein